MCLTTRKLYVAAAFFAVYLLLQGCATAPLSNPAVAGGGGNTDGLQQTSFSNGQKGKIAQDLVYVITRLKEFPTRVTTLQMVEPVTPFGEQVLEQLRIAGYGLQFVDGDHGQNFVRFRAQTAETEFGVRWEYRLSVGDVQIKREYRLAGGTLVPGSQVSITGTEPQGVLPDDSQFDTTLLDPALSKVVVDEQLLQPEILELKPKKRLIVAQVTPQTNADTNNRNANSATADTATPGARPAAKLREASVRKNVYEHRKSNFEAVFKDFESLRREALTFPKDSVQIGIEQENTIASLAKEFREDEHIVSIVGYSHGRTGIRNGNQKLAEGRASSVRDALVSAGIDPQRVFFEASWSVKPTRAVQWRSAVVKLMGRR